MGLTCAASACREPTSIDSLERLWLASQPGITRSRAALSGRAVIFGSGDGRLIARDTATGAVLWSTGIAGPQQVQCADILTNAQVVIGCGWREVIAVNASDGAIKWRFEPPADVAGDGLPGYLNGSHLVLDGTTLLVPAWGASVTALDLVTGAVRWSWQPGRLPTDTSTTVFRSGAVGAAVSGDTVFVSAWHFTSRSGGTLETLLLALDRSTGQELWRAVLPTGSATVRSAPIVAGPLVIVAPISGHLVALRKDGGAVAWSFRSPDFRWTTSAQPAFADGTLYFDGGDERTYAIDATDGSTLWSTPLRYARRDLVATARYVYVPSDNHLYVLDRPTGRIQAIAAVDASSEIFESSVAASGSRVFVMTTAGAMSFREP